MTKTLQDIERLKKDWFDDPCWDIENTDGFEEYASELKEYRLYCEDVWLTKRRNELEKKADLLGFPGNPFIAKYIERLEDRITSLEEIVENIRYKDGNTH